MMSEEQASGLHPAVKEELQKEVDAGIARANAALNMPEATAPEVCGSFTDRCDEEYSC